MVVVSTAAIDSVMEVTIGYCMRKQPGETLTAQVSIMPAAATRLPMAAIIK